MTDIVGSFALSVNVKSQKSYSLHYPLVRLQAVFMYLIGPWSLAYHHFAFRFVYTIFHADIRIHRVSRRCALPFSFSVPLWRRDNHSERQSSKSAVCSPQKKDLDKDREMMSRDPKQLSRPTVEANRHHDVFRPHSSLVCLVPLFFMLLWDMSPLQSFWL